MAAPTRVRYAPSPTGLPHVGNVRSALFNWLFARRHGGVFIVRIEDTDQQRKVEGALEAILDSLAWLGLDWDEGPGMNGQPERGAYGSYFQSKRTQQGLYRQHADLLVSKGAAYRCYCTTVELDQMRERQRAKGLPPMYDRRCRNLDAAGRAEREAKDLPCVIRFAVPLNRGETAFNDLIRGDVSFKNEVLDDFVLLKSDGYPTYHLANVVDDHLMEISHVMRAEEWVPSTPRHVLLYKAFGWEPPLFAHLPMILGPDRSKLSKRHGATALTEYRDQGFLAEAMMNFLALLGWSLDDKTELLKKDDLVKHFSIERIHKSAAIFNIEKLEWMNGVYIREMPDDVLAKRITPFLNRDLPPEASRPVDAALVARIVPLIKDRIKRLGRTSIEGSKAEFDDPASLTDFFFVEAVSPKVEDLVQKKMDRDGTLKALEGALTRVESVASWEPQPLEAALRPLADELGIKAGQLFGTIRVAITGKSVAPPLFETMTVLGRDRTVTRMRKALESLCAV
ncbi:MAG: glutamate--tRNA ligase [Chloroflexi bacterium]|nr:glutamate--tRNA ligase [Chloroflexota bacterium]